MKKVNTVRVKLLPSQSCGIGETVAGALTQQPKAVEEVTPRRARLSDIEMLQMSAWLDAGDAGRIGEESLADALARLSSLALEGNEDATKMLIVAGNSIASSLSILWIGPGNAQRRPLLRALAAKERRFPVSYHSIEENNIGWKKMVTDLGVGSDGPERTDGNQRTLPDVVDFLIKASIQTHEWFRNTSNPAMVPAKYSTFVDLEMVRENTKALAKAMVELYKASCPDLVELGKARPIAFSTLGRNFRKRQERKKKVLIRRRARALEIALGPKKLRNGMTSVDAFDVCWDKIVRTELAKMKQTESDIQADLVEAISSRLKTRLKASPKKPD